VTAVPPPAGGGPGGAARLEVRGIRVEAVHGVGEAERRRPQPFEVDLDLYLAHPEVAAATDELTDTADYAAAVEAAARVLEGPPRRLLEALAEEVAVAVLADEHLSAVTVWVRKLRPPLTRDLRSAAVQLTRHR
jgi:dihydroneopterin aldolase